MANENYISLMTDELYRWFHMLNQKYFADELPEPIITIQKTRKNIRGYFTLDKVWQVEDEDGNVDENNSRYEICMSANWLKLDKDINSIVELVAVLQHELCHYANKLKDIKDCSGKVHNKRFREMAETKDLEVEKDKRVGYGITSATERLKDFIENEIKPDESLFKYYRIIPEGPKKDEEEKKKFIAYVCPVCGKEAKGEEGMALMCAECEVALEEKPKGKRGRKKKEDDNEGNDNLNIDDNETNDN